MLSAVGQGFGTGHQTRMQDYYDWIRKKALTAAIPFDLQTPPYSFQDPNENQIHSYLNHLQENPHALLFLLDLRDTNPFPFLKKGAVVTLDNQHSNRKQLEKNAKTTHPIFYYDSLIHPRLEIKKTLDQALIPPSLWQRKQNKQIMSNRKALVYAGPFEMPPKLLKNLCRLQKTRQLDQITWIGKPFDPKTAAFTDNLFLENRLSRIEFIKKIDEAAFVFCYPGMTLLEAWFLEKKIFLLPTQSQVHNTLNQHLKNMAGFTLIKENDMTIQQDALCTPSFSPSGRGYEILFEKLKRLALKLK